MLNLVRCRHLAAGVAFVVLHSPWSANAIDHLIGHKASTSKYAGKPAVGRLFKLVAKAGSDGNPPLFALPSNPSGTDLLTVERDGGALVDALTAGTWQGLGNPVGSKGWKYRNPNAPSGGEVKLLLIKDRSIKLVTKGTGTMPGPVGASGALRVVIQVGTQRYCAEANPPHFKTTDGRVVKTREQPAPSACAPPCSLGIDSDGDAIDDCYEDDTGVFVDEFATGTDPLDLDSDDDGLSDGDEIFGTAGGLDLAGLGVNPLRQDILIEYDWFDDNLECGSHSHRPADASLASVTAMFAAAPVVNPDGSTGIHFIHDKGQGGLLTGGNLIADANGVLVGGVGSAEFQTYKAKHFAPNREGYFHYTILPHRYDTNSTSSGQAEIWGDDMIVSLYCANSVNNVAHTIVHELGHNLGLLHGGGDFCNYKPNYNSVMNYRYQFPGIDANCTPPGDDVLDYSIGVRLTLDETNLDENEGVCGAPAWDWNGNSTIESGVSFDINSQDDLQVPACGGTLSTLSDHDDWANIDLAAIDDSVGARTVGPVAVIDCDNPAPGGP
jgi:hypothetical protein